MTTSKPVHFAPIIFMLILVSLLTYMIMVSPTERANILQSEETIGAKITIAIRANAFTPEIAEIKVGEAVAWVNRDNVKHRINGVNFKSGILNPGQTYTHRFTERGIYVYSCEFYPGAIGQVIVK